MASYNELNALIDAYINRNGVQAITGQILNGVLKAMVEQLGRGYTIMGEATPAIDPGTPDGPECYFASETGTYTNFDGLQVAPGELALLCYTPSDGWTKATIYEGFRQVGATIDGNVGIPSVGVSYANGVLSFDFHNMKGNPGQNGQDGQDGAAAGFGTIGADITGGVGTPGVTVESSGPATAKNLQFHFTNLKGETGVTSVVATVDNTSGTPSCQVSLVGQQLTLAFSGLKGLKGDTGVSADYPITIYNGRDSDATDAALAAAQGKVLQGEITQLEAKVNGLNTTLDWTLVAGTASVVRKDISLEKDVEYTVTTNSPISATQMQIVYTDDSTEYWLLSNGETTKTFSKDVKAINTFISNPAYGGTLTINFAGKSSFVYKDDFDVVVQDLEDLKTEVDGKAEQSDLEQLSLEVSGFRATLEWTLVAGTASVVSQNISLNKDEEYTITTVSPLSATQMQVKYTDDTTEYLLLSEGETKKTFNKDVKSISTFISNPASSGTLTLNFAVKSPFVYRDEFNVVVAELTDVADDVEDLKDFAEDSELLLESTEKVLSWDIAQGVASIEDRPIKILKGTYFTILRNELLSSPGFRFIYTDDSYTDFALGYSKPLLFYAEKEIKSIRTFMGSPAATGTLTIDVKLQSLISEQNKARIVIPSKMYAVVGEEFNLYYDCIGLTAPGATEDFCPYLFDVECSIGGCGVKSYRLTPTVDMLNSGNPKEYPFIITLFDNFGNVLEQHASNIVVVPRRILSSGSGYLPIGDSNTAGFSYVPKHIQNFLDNIDEGKITEVGIMGFINRVLAGANQYFAHTGISGATMNSFTTAWQSGVYNNYYKCTIIGYDMNTPRQADNVKNISQNQEYLVVEYELDNNGDGYVVLSSALSNPVPVIGEYVWANDSQTVKFTITSVSALSTVEILKTNGDYDWPAFISRNSIPEPIDIISIDLGINDCGQGNTTVFRDNSVFDSFVNGCKEIIDSFLAYNPNGYVILCLPKSPAASRCSMCQDGYRVNLHNLRKRILDEFDNGAYNSQVLISQCGLAIDRRLGYWLATDLNSGNEIYASSFFEGSTPADTFKYNPDGEGFHPAERGCKQVAYAMAGAILYADYLMSQS